MKLNSNFFCTQRIPVVFAKRHCKNMLNPVFLEAPHGKAWEVEVENSQGQIWLAKGWKDFCGYYSITVRSLLIFTYNPRSHFDVAIYDQSTTEIEYPIDQEIESDEEEEDIPVLQANANVIEEEEEDIPVNLQTNANVIEEDLPINLQTNANVIEQEISEGYEEHDQRNNPTLVPLLYLYQVAADQEVGEANSRSEEVGPKNSSRYSFVNLNGDNPYFEMVIKKTHATCMTIPMRFAQSTDIINMKNMRLVNEEGVEWGVEIEYNRSMVIIKGGWTAFRKDNKIANGETCRFKLIRGHIANVLQVQKIPTPLSLQ
ncbi:hypothetical protein MTR67_008389 [Solanum verrucosum]|uniref:TF-B3 domain-containing protein n=1 Tax=Solanum verrucosum TaxID=315347 RepID=A0AAF0Q7W1_SOLVR|nr:hypothetical protein MTR67_008389 [Solanum verrucosum]